MSSHPNTPDTNPAIDPTSDAHTCLRGKWVWIARGVWLAVFLFTVGLYVANLPNRHALFYSDDNAITVNRAGVHVTDPPGAVNDIQGIEADFTPRLATLGPRAADVVYVGRGCNLDLPYPIEPTG